MRNESMLIGFSLYDSPWYNYSISLKKYIIIMLTASERPLEIMIGEFTVMSLEVFQSMMNASYSYFNLLRSTMNR